MTNRILSVVIPVYNEAKTILSVLELVHQVDTTPYQKQIIVVDDGSTDGTRELLQEYKSKHPEATIISSTNAIWGKEPRCARVSAPSKERQ